MARATARQAKLRFEKRYEVKLRQRLEIPEVRDAVAAIRRGAWANWKAGEPFESPHPVQNEPTRGPWPFWFERHVCRRNGMSVWVEARDKKRPIVHLGLTIEGEDEDLAARVEYPQDLTTPAEYDLWEIKRDAPLSRILEDVEYQWRELHDERTLHREGRLFTDSSEPPRTPPRRQPSTDRELWAIESYRRRYQGEMWREIARALDKSQSTVRSAVTDLCKRTGLPWPRKGSLLPDAPDVDCDNCAKRPSPSTLCAECPWVRYADKYLGPPDSPRDAS